MPSSEFGIGRYVAGEGDVFWYPKGYQRNNTVRGVVYCHGAGQLASSILNVDNLAYNQAAMLAAIASQYPLLSIDAGIWAAGDETDSNSFGNPNAQTRVGQGVTWIQGTGGAKAGTVVLIGFSMGHVLSMNYALANPTKVACIVSVLPVNDLDDVRNNDRGGYRAAISNAFRTVHTGCSTTNGSPTIVDASIRTADLGCAVSGTNIPASRFVGTVTNGVSYQLSSSASSQVNANASGTGGALTHTLLRTWVSTNRPGLPIGANPAVNPSAFAGIKQRLWYTTDDPICTAATVTALAAGAGANCETFSIGTGGHTEAAIGQVPIADVLSYIALNAG